MGRLAALRTAQVAPNKQMAGVPNDNVAEAKARADKSQQTGLGKLAAFIPSEAVTFYVAGAALIVTFPVEAKASALAVVAVVSVLGNFALTLLAFKQTIAGTFGSVLTAGRFWAAVVVATLALAVYAVCLPGSPYLGDATYLSGLILLVGGFGIPLLGSLVGIAPVPAKEPEPVVED